MHSAILVALPLDTEPDSDVIAGITLDIMDQFYDFDKDEGYYDYYEMIGRFKDLFPCNDQGWMLLADISEPHKLWAQAFVTKDAWHERTTDPVGDISLNPMTGDGLSVLVDNLPSKVRTYLWGDRTVGKWKDMFHHRFLARLHPKTILTLVDIHT